MKLKAQKKLKPKKFSPIPAQLWPNHKKVGRINLGLPAVIGSPEECVVEHLFGRRESIDGQARQLERLKPEFVSRQFFKFLSESVGEMLVVVVLASPNQGEEVAAMFVQTNRVRHLSEKSSLKNSKR